MSEFETANHYAFSDNGVQGLLATTSISGSPTAELAVDGRTARDVEVAEQGSHWLVTGVLGHVHDAHTISAALRIPVVHLDVETETVPALLAVITARTSIAGVQGVQGPLETYETRLVDAVASATQS